MLVRIDKDDAELLALLVSHLSKKGRNVNLKDIKRAFYDADVEKDTFLYRGKVRVFYQCLIMEP